MASFWNLHAEAGCQLHGGHGCHFSPGPLYELLSPRAPPPVHVRGFRRPSTGILYSGHKVSTEDTMITDSDRHMDAFENSISDRPSGGNLLSLGNEESLNFSLRLSHPGSNIYFSSYRAQGFYKHYWGYVRGSFLSHTGHCSHSHPTGWQLLLAGRPGFCIQKSATTVWVGNEPDSKSGQWH